MIHQLKYLVEALSNGIYYVENLMEGREKPIDQKHP